MRRALALAVTIVALQSCAPVFVEDEYGNTTSSSYFGFEIDYRSAPPPPSIYWRGRPDVDRIRGTAVYVVNDPSYDIFLYSDSYWLTHRGYWYTAQSWEGPFVTIDVRSVPRQVLSVPDRHWRHHPRDRRGRYRDRDWDGRS